MMPGASSSYETIHVHPKHDGTYTVSDKSINDSDGTHNDVNDGSPKDDSDAGSLMDETSVVVENTSPLIGLLLLVVVYWTYPLIITFISLLILPYTMMVEVAAVTASSLSTLVSYLAPFLVYALGAYTMYQYLATINCSE